MEKNTRTIKRSVLEGKRATDNVSFQGGTYRIDAGWRITDSTIKLAKTDRGAECVEDFIEYQIIDD